MMLGDQSQRDTFARALLKISANGTSDDISKRVSQTNEKLFSEEMCARILRSIPEVAMYDDGTLKSGKDTKM